LAITITALVLGLSAIQWLPTSIAVLLGVVLLVLTRCLTMDEALAVIEWKTVFVIAGMLPLSIAMQKTGLAATLGQFAVHSIGAYGFLALAGGLYIVTTALTQVIGGQVTALVMAPIAVAAASASDVSPRNIGIVVAIACSSSFLTPLAHPVNLLMVGPGGYTFRDWTRVGVGLLLVCFVVLMAGTWLLPGG
jgi:di/tricarboxylate transporter